MIVETAAGGAHRPLPHPERQDVGHRVLAGVAHQLRDQQQRDQPGDEEPDGVQEPVVAGQRDDPGDAEEARGRHVVAADRHPVLEPGERPATGVEVRRVLGLPAGPDRDRERDHHKDDEQDDRMLRAVFTRCHRRSRLRPRSRWASGSSWRLAYRAYSQAMRNVDTNWSSPKTSATLMLPTILVPMKSRA